MLQTHDHTSAETKTQPAANILSAQQTDAKATLPFEDNRPEAIQMKALQDMANKSVQVKQLKAYQDMANQNRQPMQLPAVGNSPSVAQRQDNSSATIQKVGRVSWIRAMLNSGRYSIILAGETHGQIDRYIEQNTWYPHRITVKHEDSQLTGEAPALGDMHLDDPFMRLVSNAWGFLKASDENDRGSMTTEFGQFRIWFDRWTTASVGKRDTELKEWNSQRDIVSEIWQNTGTLHQAVLQGGQAPRNLKNALFESIAKAMESKKGKGAGTTEDQQSDDPFAQLTYHSRSKTMADRAVLIATHLKQGSKIIWKIGNNHILDIRESEMDRLLEAMGIKVLDKDEYMESYRAEEP